MDPVLIQAQSNAVRAIGEAAHASMLANGLQDWATCSVVLRTEDVEETEVTGWMSMAWDTKGEYHSFRLDLKFFERLNDFRAITTVDETKPAWRSALLQFDRSGRSRVEYEFENDRRWWRNAEEDVEEHITRLRPNFPARA